MTATWDETWMAVADTVSRRSECLRGTAGAVVVDSSNRVVATGYNGPPAGLKMGCDTCPRHIFGPESVLSYTDCITIHAEANSLLFCDRRDREGGTIYVSTNCCFDCGKLVANSGLARVVMRQDRAYRKPLNVTSFLEESGLEVVTWTD